MNMPCPRRVDCPPDGPILNYSSESEDFLEFFAIAYSSIGCLRVCVSAISQEDATLCAERQRVECESEEDGEGGGGGNPVFPNDPQTCTVSCPDGTQFSYTVAAGAFVAETQEMANAQAYSYACNQAELLKVCLGDLILGCCLGQTFSATVSLTGPARDFSFIISAGTLPTGIALEGGVISDMSVGLSGVPTAAGNFTFTLTGQDALGGTVTRQYTFGVIEITTDTLPLYRVGVAYNQQLNATGGSGTYIWSLISGTLPAGLVLSPTGAITGTPTVSAGDVTITVQASDTTSAVSCTKELQLNEYLFSFLMYYKMEEAPIIGGSRRLVEEVAALNLRLFNWNSSGSSIIVGHIGNAVFDNALLASTDLTPKLNMHGKSFTFRAWFRCNHPGMIGSDMRMADIASLIRIMGLSVTTDPGPPQVFGAYYGGILYPLVGAPINFRHTFLWGEVGHANPADDWLDTNWHRFIVIVDVPNLKLSMRVDAGVPEEVALPAGIDFVNSNLFLALGNQTGGKRTDEMGIWPGYIWTEADATNDWNGGAGRTFPNVPMI